MIWNDLFFLKEKYGYKPQEHTLNGNSRYNVPQYIVTTHFKDGYHTQALSTEECFKLVYGITLQEYRKRTAGLLQKTSKEGSTKPKEESTR